MLGVWFCVGDCEVSFEGLMCDSRFEHNKDLSNHLKVRAFSFSFNQAHKLIPFHFGNPAPEIHISLFTN